MNQLMRTLAVALALACLGAGLPATAATTAAGLTPATTARALDGELKPPYPVFARRRYAVPAGARFNNPLGEGPNRNLIRHVIRTIDSMPGYRLPKGRHCPRKPALIPARIRISLYSVADQPFAEAMIAAHRRCISVQLLMNSHLDPESSDSFGRIQRAVGTDRSNRSFARRCFRGCRGGSGPLHTKMFLFDSNDLLPRKHRRIKDTVMVGSTNMTRNAARVQWNDLFTIKRQPKMFRQYADIFGEMARDKRVRKPLRVMTAGPYQSTFFPHPSATPRTDRTMKALRSISCTRAKAPAGVDGRTRLIISMHAWHGDRGRLLARKVRGMYDAGCHVQILYSFMSREVHQILTNGTGPRMDARRTIFSDDGDDHADVYSHLKVFAASGNVGGDRSAWVTWTGSANFSPRANHADEVMLRIPGRSVFADYRSHLNFIRKRKSSPVWASYLEPVGGGRPPEDRTAARVFAESLAVEEPVPFVTASRAEIRD